MKLLESAFAVLLGMVPGALSAQWIHTSVSKEIDAIVTDGVNLYGAGYDTAIYRSTDGGQVWSIVENQGGPRCANGLVFSDGFLYACANTVAGVYRSSDQGATWKFLNHGLTDDWAISIAARGALIFVGEGDTKIFRSTDSGETWVEASKGMDGGFVTALAIAGNYVFAGTGTNGVYRSSDNGNTWQAFNNGISTASVWAFTLLDSTLFAGIEYGSAFDGGVYRSTNWGESWALCATGWSGYGCPCLLSYQRRVFAGTLGGTMYSDNEGASWKGLGQGINFVWTLCALNGNLFAGTVHNGIFRMSLSQLSVSNMSRSQESSVLLDVTLQIPTLNKLSLSFKVSHRTRITMTITDATGRESTIYSGPEMEIGPHQITWDASRFPAGVYAYRLTAGAESVVKKLVVMH